MEQNHSDVIVIGAGPTGLNCGIEAARNGISCKIIEKGCLVNSLFHYPTNMIFFSTSERLEIGDVPFISHGDKPTRREALEYYRRVLTHWNLDVHLYEKVEEVQKKDDHFQLNTSRGTYTAGAVVVATGFFDFPNLLNVPGEDLPKVKHYYNEAHPYVGQDVAVIGGGNSAVDVALETFRRGARVVMIVREPHLKDGIKYWVKPDIENRIKEGSIPAFFNSHITEIREKEIDVCTPEGPITLPNDFVLAMTGYQPDYSFLRKLGIDISGDERRIPVYDPETMETNVPGIFLAGVICGGMETNRWTLENSKDHAAKIFRYLNRQKHHNF